jgi:hypothetical protein
MRSSPFPAAFAGLVGGVVCAATLALLSGCPNATRKQDCEKFLSAMTPMQGDVPTVDAVDRTHDSVASIQFEDEPLREYSTNYKNTLAVLSSTLRLKATAGPDGPPDGTDDVIKRNLKDARTDFDDVSRYCAQ